MAYQNVGTPRFYVNVYEWVNALGRQVMEDGSPYNPILNTLPVKPVEFVSLGDFIDDPIYQPSITSVGGENIYHCFYAVLGHDFIHDFMVEYSGFQSEVINGSTGSGYKGFTIVRTQNLIRYVSHSQTGGPFHAGSVIVGVMYDMPNAPNLSLTMSREYGSTKEFSTYNGSTMSNTMWNSQPMWGDLGAWELDDGTSKTQKLSRSGRRTWNLQFSFMADSDLWGSNQLLLTNWFNPGEDIAKYHKPMYTETDYESGDYDSSADAFNYNLLTDYNFFSQVWHKTLGGTLPFIFQPDNTNNNPDQFAICRFKENSLKATQSAFNVYDISLSLEEVW